MSKNDLPNIKDVSSIPDELVPVIQWWKRHGTKASLIAAAVIAIGSICYWWVSKQDALTNQTAVGLAMAKTAEEFKANADQGASSATVATIAYMRALNLKGEYKLALDAANSLPPLEEPFLKEAFAMNKAIALEGMKKFDDALATLKTIPETSIFKADKVYAEARCYVQKGEKAKAIELAKTLNNERIVNIISAYGTALSEPAPAPVVVETPEVPAEAPAVEPAPEAPVAPEAPATPVEAPAAEAATPAPEAPAAQ